MKHIPAAFPGAPLSLSSQARIGNTNVDGHSEHEYLTANRECATSGAALQVYTDLLCRRVLHGRFLTVQKVNVTGGFGGFNINELDLFTLAPVGLA